MANIRNITLEIQSQLELNHAYMPFIVDGGLFIQVKEDFNLGDEVVINAVLPGMKEAISIEGRVVWITPKNALDSIFSGIGVQFTGERAKGLRDKIISNLDNTMDVGGYIYGVGKSNR